MHNTKNELDEKSLETQGRTKFIYPRTLNKVFTSNSPAGSSDRQSPDEDQSAPRPKRCVNDNNYADNCPRVHNMNNNNSSSQTFRQKLNIRN